MDIEKALQRMVAILTVVLTLCFLHGVFFYEDTPMKVSRSTYMLIAAMFAMVTLIVWPRRNTVGSE